MHPACHHALVPVPEIFQYRDWAMSMGEGLPDMISKMNKLKIELNIPFDENDGKPKLTATSPQNIGK